MNTIIRASLILLAWGAPAFAQLVPPNSLPPPISPPLLPRPAHDPNPPAEPQPEVAAPAVDADEPPPEILPPESGLLVTPGHRIVGCVQVPIYRERGPYLQVIRWPNGVIPFQYDGNVSQMNRNLFNAAMAEVESYAGVNFVARDTFHPSWLHIQNANVNNAPIGMRPGTNIVNIRDWTVHYTLVHELFHVLGVYHEQSRVDRNTYVTINWSNISQTNCPPPSGSCDSNFQIESESGTFGLYLFDSFMHYGRSAFPLVPGIDTITVQPPFAAVWQNRIGQRSHATFGDRSMAMFMHQPSWCKVAQIGANPNGPGTWSSPFNNFPDAYNAAPNNGDVVLRPGYYTGLGLRIRPMRLHAPDGSVRIGQ